MQLRRYLPVALAAVALEAAYLALAQLGSLRQQVPEFVPIYLAGSTFYLVSCWYITNRAGLAARGLMVLIWTTGILFRLTVLPLDPGLSEDLYRYRWQGQLQAAGGNPYIEVPEDPRWAELQDSTWPQVNRKDLPSVYGPVLERVYAAHYQLASSLTEGEQLQAWSFKLPFALLELGVALALARLLRFAGRPATCLLIYLWSPLVVVEFWAQGHNDPAAMLFVVLALTASLRAKWTWAFLWLTLATLCKFWPAALFPFFLLRKEEGRWRLHWKPALITLPVTLLASAPYLGGISEVTEMLEAFLGGWRNNDSLFALIYHWQSKDFEAATAVVKPAVALAVIGIWALQLPLTQAAQWVAVALLFLSANCFPWYLSWFLPFLAIHPNAGLLLWTALVSLAYHILIPYGATGVWQDVNEFRLLEYVPVYGVLIGSGLVKWWQSRVSVRP